MANTLITPSIVAREMLMLLENNMVAASLVHRDHTSEFTGAKVGDTITVRGPASFEAKEYNGTSIEVQDIKTPSVQLTLEKHFDVSIKVSSKEWTLELDKFSEIVLAPVALAFAEAIDRYVLSKYVEVYNFVGTAGDPPDSLADVVAVDRKLNEMKVPVRGRNAIVNPLCKADMLSNISQMTDADKRSDGGEALRDASMGYFMGVQWHMAQLVHQHTAGTPGGTPTATGTAGATQVSVAGGSDSGTFKKGDLITIAGNSQQFVVTEDLTLSQAGAGTLKIFPALPSGFSPSGAAITLVGSHAANLAFHRNAITLAVVPFELPQGAAQAAYMNARGLGIRVVYGYDMASKSDTISFDVLAGAKVQQPELITRILG